MKPPKIGKLYREIVEKGCRKELTTVCPHNYEWACNYCPVIIEKIKIQKKKDALEVTVRICSKCKTKYEGPLDDNFHDRGVDKYGITYKDPVCKVCRRDEAKTYFNRQGSKKRKKLKIIKNFECFDRGTAQNFKHYMLNNPYYFERIFEKPATIENIKFEFSELKRKKGGAGKREGKTCTALKKEASGEEASC